MSGRNTQSSEVLVLLDSVRQAAPRTVEFGIYRDGDNNLDRSQGVTLRQALQSSETDRRVEFTVQDTTSAGTGTLRTDSFTLRDGGVGEARVDAPHDMASEKNLAHFVAHVLDNAQKSGEANLVTTQPSAIRCAGERAPLLARRQWFAVQPDLLSELGLTAPIRN